MATYIPQQREDDPHTSLDRGVPILVVRQDTDGVMTSTDGDYSCLSVDSAGRLKLRAEASNGGVLTTRGIQLAGSDGLNARFIKTDGAGELQIDVLSLPNEGQQTMANSISVAVASNQSAIPIAPQPQTSGGWLIKNCTSGDGSTALTNSAQAIKASAGQLGGWYIYNPNTSVIYVPIYNVASGSVTVGTTNPAMVLAIPASSGANLELVHGLEFSTAISVAAATTAGGNTAPTTALEANFWYK